MKDYLDFVIVGGLLASLLGVVGVILLLLAALRMFKGEWRQGIVALVAAYPIIGISVELYKNVNNPEYVISIMLILVLFILALIMESMGIEEDY